MYDECVSISMPKHIAVVVGGTSLDWLISRPKSCKSAMRVL